MAWNITMFYDGGCPLCRREVHHYRRLDRAGNIGWIDINVQEGRLAAFGLTREDAMARLHVLDADGQLQTGAAAFVALWSALPYYRWLARLIRFLRLIPVLEFFYTPFARWRLGRRRSNCPV